MKYTAMLTVQDTQINMYWQVEQTSKEVVQTITVFHMLTFV